VKSWHVSFSADVDYRGVQSKPGVIRFRASGAGMLAARASSQGYVWAGTGTYAVSSHTRVDWGPSQDMQWVSDAAGGGTAPPLSDLAPGQQEPWTLVIDGECRYQLLLSNLQAPLEAWGWNRSGHFEEQNEILPFFIRAYEQALPEEGIAIYRRMPATVDSTSGASADVQVYADSSWAPYYNFPNLERGTGTFEFMVAPEPEELELIVDAPGYERWAPKGRPNADGPGNRLALEARLQQRGGGAPGEKASQIRFELTQVSAEPGVALDHPPANVARVDPDLRFEADRNTHLRVSDDGLRAETPAADGAYREAKAELGAFDWGAWGELRVSAVMGDGRRILGRLRDDPRPQILLPRRRPGSRIPEALRESAGLGDQRDDADEESEPQGDGFAGDGLTLYEEYRGFYLDGRHVRGDPRRKDLFVLDEIGGRSKLGIARFARETGLRVHHELARGDLESHRIINVNHMEAPHRVDQHALVLSVRATGGPAGRVVSANRQPGTPETIERVIVDPSLAPASPGFPRVVAHELSHAVNVWHHGATDAGWVTWTRENRLGRPVTVEAGRVIDLRSEDGRRLRLDLPELEVWVAAPHGQHSGSNECYMRYFLADAYRENGDAAVRYWTDGAGEPAGALLCRATEGTGVNAAARQPRPRHHDASRCSGTCVQQVRVNDRGDPPVRSPCPEDGPAASDEPEPASEAGGWIEP
jgi:hypothetical protein